MQSRTWSAVIVVALVAAAVVLFVVLSDDDEDGEQAATTTAPTEKEGTKASEPKPELTTIIVKGGQPVGGVQELEYTRGEEVRFEVEADIAEEVHVHGYDVIKDVAPGKPASFSFPADIDGVFEVELEGSHTQIAELTVQPG
jgi:heme/copper-type cytochrome/quinol oxidase subunit 2